MKSIACFVVVVGLLFSTRVLAQEAKEPPLITVTGTAEVNVVPDIAQLSFGVETRDRDLALARSRNNTAVSAILAVVRKFGD